MTDRPTPSVPARHPTDRPRHRRLPGSIRLASRAGARRLSRRGASRAALERLGDATWAAALDFLYEQRRAGRWATPRHTTRPGGSFFGDRAVCPPPHRTTRRRPRRSSTSSARGSPRGQMNAQHPRQFGYFTPPPLPIVDHGRAPRPDGQPGRRRLARRARSPRSSRRRSSAGCATSSGTTTASFGLLTSGGVMANFMAHDDRARRAPRPAARARPAAARRGRSRASGSTLATRRTSRSPARSTARASRARPSSSSRRTSGSGCGARRSPRRSRATGPPA